MNKYEYKVVVIPIKIILTSAQVEKHLKELESEMNKLGLEGWELVQKVDAFYYFKRKVID